MGFGLLSFVILFANVWQRKFCDATPILKLTGESKFKIGDNRTLTCLVNQDVDLLSVSFFKGITETIWISNPSPTSCSFFNLIPDDNSSYSTTCDPFNGTFTMTKYKLDARDNNTAWFCQMKSVPGGNGSCVGTNNSCTSGNVTFYLSVTTPNTSVPSTAATTTVYDTSTTHTSIQVTNTSAGNEMETAATSLLLLLVLVLVS